MSSTTDREVDERVVQMTFNNAEFEKGVSKSLSTLEKLKRALDFKHRPTGLEDFGRAIGSIEQNLAPMAKDVDHIADRFTALGIIGDQVIRNLTNKVVNFGEHLVKSATVEPLTSGFKEYETQMKSIQTILANTGMEGKLGVAKVNAALDELNEYADKTIYNFTEMTNNIGRFTAAGVKLQPAVDAIKGTANLAAMSGSTSEQASRAMYNLSQALSTGTLKLMDWNSVVNAGMGGQVFQDALIQAGAALDGMGNKVDEWKKKNIDKFGSFRDSLSKGWITSDVLSLALKNFTYDVEEGTKEYEEALKELTSKGYTEDAAKNILKVAKQATEAATKVRTFTQLIDTLKEALGSGWAQSWRIIFGDFYEATELWTGISDALGGLIDNISKVRNEALSTWKGFDEGGRLDLLEAMKELVYDIALIIKPIADAFHDIFGEFNAESLRKATLNFKNFVKQLHPSLEGFNAIKRIATTVFSIIKNGITIATRGISAVLTVGRPLLYLADSLLVAFSDLLDAIVNNTLFARMAVILSTVGRFISAVLTVAIIGLIKAIYGVGAALRSLSIDGFVATVIKVGRSFVEWVKNLTPVKRIMGVFNKLTNGATTAIDGFVNIIANGLTYLSNLFNYISNLPMVQNTIHGISVVLAALWSVLVGIKDVVVNIFSSIGSIDLMQIANPLELIKAIVLSVVNNIVNGINKAGDAIAARFPLFNTLRSMVTSVVDAFKAGIGKLKEFFTTLAANGVNFEGGTNGLKSIIDAIKEFIAVIDPAKLAALSITMVMLGMCLTFIRIGNLMAVTVKNFNNILTAVTKGINGFVNTQTNKIIQAAEAVLMVAAAIAILAGIPGPDLDRAAKVLLALIVAMGVIQIILERAKKLPTFESGDFTKNIVELGGIALRILQLSAAFAIMIDTLKKVKELNFKELGDNLIGVLVAFGSVIVVAVALDRLKIGFSKGTLGILVLSAAIWSLCSALKQLEGLKAYNIRAALEGLIPMMAMLTAISFAAKGIGLTTGLGLILTARAIEYLLPQIERIYNAFKKSVDFDAVLTLVEKHQEGFALISAALFGLAAIAGIFGKGLKNFANAVVAMAASFVIMAYALDKIAEVVGKDNTTKAVVIFAGMGVLISAWLLLASRVPEKSAILKVGVAIVLMSSALLIMNVALSQLASMNWDANMIWPVAVLGGMMLLLTLMLNIAGKAGEAKGAFGVMASMMAGLSVIIAEMIGLSFINPKELIFPLIAVSTIMLLMTRIMKTVTGVTYYNTQGVLAMVGVVASMVVMLQALTDLSKLDPKSVFAASVSMSIVILSLSNMVKQLSKFSGTFDANKGMGMFFMMVGVIAALGAVAYALQQLAVYDFKSLLAAGAALGGVITIFGLLAVYISKNAPDWQKGLGALAVLAGFGLAILAVAGSLYLLKDINGDQLLKSAISVTGAMLGIGLLITVFDKLNVAGLKGAAIAALGIGAFVLIILTVFAAIQALLDGLKSIGIDVWGAIKDFAKNVGETYGTFVSAFGNVAAGTMEKIANSLTTMAESMKSFFESTKSIDESSIKGAYYLALAIGVIANANFIDGISNLLGFGGSSLDKFKESMPKLAEAITSYANTINAVNEKTKEKPDFTKIEASTNALSLLSKTLSELPKEGGLLDGIFGTLDLQKFGVGMATIAIGLVAYARTVEQVSDWDAIDPSITALSKLATVAKQIPTEEGLLNYIFGTTDIGSFGSKMGTLAQGIADYATNIKGVTQQDFDKMKSSMTALKSVVDVAKQIPNAGGVLGDVFGNNDIDDFGVRLGKFAGSFAQFSYDIATTDTHAVNRNARALGNFVDSLLGTEKLNLYTFDEIVPHIQQAMESMLNGIVSSIGEHLDLVTEAVKSLAEAIVEEATHHNSEMRAVGREYADRIGKGLSSQGSITQLATDMESLVSNAIEKAKENIKTVANESGAEIGQEFVNGVIGPDGIDPDENPGPQEPSDKLLDNVKSLAGNAFEQAADAVAPITEKAGSFLGEDFVNNTVIGAGNLVENLKGIAGDAAGTFSKVMNGELSLTDALGEITGGHDVWSALGFDDIFKVSDIIGDGTDIEREITKALGGGGGGAADDVTKSLKGTSSALSKAKDNLNTYTKYLKYSAKVEEEFAKTTGAAMSVFSNDKPIKNASVAVAALAEQIYADSQKVKDAIEDTSETAIDRSVAVMKAFNDDYEAIKKSVGDSVDIFKNFYSEEFTTAKGSTVISNITSQLEGYNSMATKFQILATRGIPMDYIQELASKGSEGFGELQTVLNFTTEETRKFVDVWTEYQSLGDKIAADVMSAKATALAVEQLRKAAAGAKTYNKQVKELYLNHHKLLKEAKAAGEDPLRNKDVMRTYTELHKLAAETGTDLEALGDSLKEHSAESAAAALELIEKYTQAESVLDKYNTTFETTRASVKDLIESQLNTFETFTKKTGISADDMIDILTSQTKGIAQWSKELSALSGRGLSQEILDDLAKLGPEGYEKVHAFYKMSDSQLSQANTLYSQKLAITDRASRTIGTSFANAAAGGIEAYKQAITDAAENKEAFEEIVEKFTTSVTDEINDMTSAQIIAGGRDVGKELTQAIADSARETKSTATDASKEVAKAATDEASETITEEGEKTVTPAAVGSVENTADKVVDAVHNETDEKILPAIKEDRQKIQDELAKTFDIEAHKTQKDQDELAKTFDIEIYKKGTKVTSSSAQNKSKEKVKNSSINKNKVTKTEGTISNKVTNSEVKLDKVSTSSRPKNDDYYPIEKEDTSTKKTSVVSLLFDSLTDRNKEILAKEAINAVTNNHVDTGNEFKLNKDSKLWELYQRYVNYSYSDIKKFFGDDDIGVKRAVNVNQIVQRVHDLMTGAKDYNPVYDAEDIWFSEMFGVVQKNSLDEYVKTLNELGRDYNLGIGDGILESVDETEKAAYLVADDIIKITRGKFEINSPSKVGVGIGEMFGLGIAMGIMNSITTISTALNDLINSIFATTELSLASPLAVNQMLQNAAFQASIMDDANATHPTITPVIDLSSAQNGFNVLGNMFGNPALNLGLNASIPKPADLPNTTGPMVAAIRASQYDDSKLVGEIGGLREDVNNLNEVVGNLQVIMDSGTLVGTIASKMDDALGTIYRRKNRG